MILFINLRINTFFHILIILRIFSWKFRGFLDRPKSVQIIHVVDLADGWAWKTSDSTISHLIILNDDAQLSDFYGPNLFIWILLSWHFDWLTIDAELWTFDRLILAIIENIVKVVNVEVLRRTLRVFVLSLFDIHGCVTSWGLVGCVT